MHRIKRILGNITHASRIWKQLVSQGGGSGLILLRESRMTFTILDTLNEGPLHAYGIIKKIRDQHQRDDTIERRQIPLYALLHALESNGLIETFGEIGANGRERQVYKLTEKGSQVITPKPHKKRSKWF